MSTGCYFSILFCFPILFTNWVLALRYFFLVQLEEGKSRHFPCESISKAVDIFQPNFFLYKIVTIHVFVPKNTTRNNQFRKDTANLPLRGTLSEE